MSTPDVHIVVCIKQVPDSAQIRVHPVTNTIMRQGVPTIINPYDLFALEEALTMRDRLVREGTRAGVTVLTMGPPMAEESLRKALTFGADRAVLLTDRAFAGSDTLATTFALSQAIAKAGEVWGKPSVVFCGKQTIDGDTAQVGPGIASRLGLNQLTYVARIAGLDIDAGTIEVERRAEGGTQHLATRLPVLVTMLEGSNEMRRGSLASALAAANAKIEVWNAAAAGITEAAKCGLKGSPTIVKKVFAPQPRAEKAALIDTAGRNADDIAQELMNTIFARQPQVEVDLLRFVSGQ
jgi:electron transfer flavoprotein beta subunit